MCHAIRHPHFSYRLNETGEKSLIGYLASATRQSLQTCQEGKETKQSAEQLNVVGNEVVIQQSSHTRGVGGVTGTRWRPALPSATWTRDVVRGGVLV